MAKKDGVKKSTDSNEKVEQVLIENFVSLQKVMTNLAVKFDSLSSQISKLLELFEISAKSLAEKDFSTGEKDDKVVSQKLDNLLEQNKIIARGITLLHESNSSEEQKMQVQPQRNLPAPQMIKKAPQDFSAPQKFQSREG